MIAGIIIAASALAFDAGADLRIRQEIMDNVPGLPGGGVLSSSERNKINHMRFRPRIWGEIKGETEEWGKWRLYTRITDEMRWYISPKKDTYTWPDEAIIDNLFIEGKGLFDGTTDISIGRQDIYALYGLDHVFVDGTPGDGSRTVYADLVKLGFKVTEKSRLDFFAIYNSDDNALRWGTTRGNHRHLSAVDPTSEPGADDVGYGMIWSSELNEAIPYQLFVISKTACAYSDSDGKRHPKQQRETFGMKTVPKITEELSLQFEAMAQTGENGDHAALSGWSSYAGLNWKSVREGWKPFAKIGYHFMSGDENAADEDGGHGSWDPIWARGVNDSEMFLYGTHYGVGYWTNMHYLKTTLGVEIDKNHRLTTSFGPMFAAAKDGLGGGEGAFKGFLSQIRYDFPLWTPDRSAGERFEIFGHLVGEWFNPGDYYETDRPAWFVRWQVDFRF